MSDRHEGRQKIADEARNRIPSGAKAVLGLVGPFVNIIERLGPRGPRQKIPTTQSLEDMSSMQPSPYSSRFPPWSKPRQIRRITISRTISSIMFRGTISKDTIRRCTINGYVRTSITGGNTSTSLDSQ